MESEAFQIMFQANVEELLSGIQKFCLRKIPYEENFSNIMLTQIAHP